METTEIIAWGVLAFVYFVGGVAIMIMGVTRGGALPTRWYLLSIWPIVLLAALILAAFGKADK